MRQRFYIKYVTKSESRSFFGNKDMSYRRGTVLVNFPGAVAVNNFLHFILDFQGSMMVESFYWRFLLASKDFQDSLRLNAVICVLLKRFNRDYVCGSSITYATIIKIPYFYRKYLVNRISFDKRVTEALINVWKQSHYIQNINYEKLLRQQIFNPTFALQSKPYCQLKKPTCNPGYQLVHSFYKEVDWTPRLPVGTFLL